MNPRAPLLLPLIIGSFLSSGSVCGQEFDQTGAAYVDVQPGVLPILISAPHGGTIQEPRILKRLYGKVLMDAKTDVLALAIREELNRLHGAPPHLVRCLLHRSKVDCNREITEGAQKDETAQRVWRTYHDACSDARQQMEASHGGGLVLDIHGHRHEKARAELGYLLKGDALDLNDMALDELDPAATSIADLMQRGGSSISEVLRGPFSLGALLEQRGFSSIPSPVNPGPEGAPYFSGGYITSTHGSKGGGSISAIQIECPWDGLRDTEANRHRFAKALAEALGPFFEKHYGITLGGAKP